MNMAPNINNNVNANSGVRQVTKNILAAVLLAGGCASAMATTNVPPEVQLLSVESNGASPATIKLDANASDIDGSIAKVEFFNGTTLIGTATQAPYTYTWTGVAGGTYSVTAKATDNIGAESVTAASSVIVGSSSAQAYYIHSDQIDTARLITNDAGQAVWKSDLEPFGTTMPDENPQGQGTFVFNNRFPGQYFDRETGLHYNYYRDYDPQTGRYVQSDPIGLDGGINTYGYVRGNPTSFVDPSGLVTIVGGVGGSYVAGGGVEGSGGIYVNPGLFGQKADAGVFASGGYGGGVNVSGSVFGGVVFGEASNVAGETTNSNGGVGPVSWTAYYSGGKWTGITVGIGPGLPAAGSLTKSNTVTGSIWDLVEWWKKRRSHWWKKRRAQAGNFCSR